MSFSYFSPSPILRSYIRCYYTYASESDTAFADTVFPSGDMEMIFNLGAGSWASFHNGAFYTTPSIELWGQVTKPMPILSKGPHNMLGVKLLPHAAAIFFDSEIGLLNDGVSDLSDVMGQSIRQLHEHLLNIAGDKERIALVDNFLLQRLEHARNKCFTIDKVADILSSIRKDATESTIERVASSHGITTRHMHKLVHRYTGLSPKSFNKIDRFQKSLRLISENKYPLTAIAYDCGYFDQSHFIRDFKSFTGITPSAFLGSKILG